MLDNNLNESVLHTLGKEFRTATNNLFEIDSEFQSGKIDESSEFNPCGEVIVIVDFIGIIAGFVAISASKKDFMALLETNSNAEGAEALALLESPIKELLNTIAGKCIKVLQAEYPTVTMLTPKFILGHISYPKVRCLYQDLSSKEGTFRLTYSLDSMKLDVTTLLNKLLDSQQTKETVVDSLHHLYGNLEKVQSHIAEEVSSTITYIKTIEKLVDKEIPELKNLMGFDLTDTIKQLDSTKDMMKNKIGDTIGDLKNFQNTLLNRLIHKKIWSGDQQLDVWLQGYLSDESNLNFFNDIENGTLNIYTTDLTGADEEGIERWRGKLNQVEDKVVICYEECSPEFIALSLQQQGFVSPKQIKSLIASFYCTGCQQNEKFIIKVNHDTGSTQLPKAICNCGSKMQLNAHQKSIQTFLESHDTIELRSITATHRNNKNQNFVSHTQHPR